MVVVTMTILTIDCIYNVVIWTIESCSHRQSQMAFTTNFVVVNGMFWRCELFYMLNMQFHQSCCHYMFENKGL
jgi:hypothetical protein